MFGAPPPIGSLKFNVDGFSKGNPRAAGIGGVLRDSEGRVLGSFSLSIGFKDSITAKVLAIHKATELCMKTPALYGKEIILSSDSMIAVAWINGNGFGSLEHYNLIYDIREWLSFLGSAFVVFNSRFSNTFAEHLTRQRSGLVRNSVIWDFN